MSMIAPPNTSVLVSPTALVLSMLHAGSPSRLPVAVARSREDFMRRVLRQPPRVAVVERGWLSQIDLRRLALRRAFSSTPRLLLVLRRDETPTPFEEMRYDAVVVAGKVFLRSAARLRDLVGDAPSPAEPLPPPLPPPPRPSSLPSLRLVA